VRPSDDLIWLRQIDARDLTATGVLGALSIAFFFPVPRELSRKRGQTALPLLQAFVCAGANLPMAQANGGTT